MAMTMKVDGMEELSAMLRQLGDKAQAVASQSLYEGAKVMADAFKGAAGSIKAKRVKYPAPEGKKRLPSRDEKQAVMNAVGVARFKTTGDGVDTLVGVGGHNGYAMIDGKMKPVRLIARAINSGTSFMDKQPVFRRAKNQFSSSASRAIADKAEQLYDEIINGKGKN